MADYEHKPEYYESKGIIHEEVFITNSRGMKLFTMSWLPANREPKALIFLIHGYAVDCGLYWQDTGSKFAENGYAVFGIDHEGHGRSDGQRAFLKTLDSVVDDCIAHFKTVRAREEYKNKPAFLYGQSMGGAVALLIHRKEPTTWNGAILMAPMVKISEKLKPPLVVVAILKRLAGVFPSWQIVPTKDVIDSANKDPVKRERVRNNPHSYTAKPRLATSLALLNAAEDIESRLDEVTLPFLLLHGEADTVTDPAVSQTLYEKAKSFDKTFKLYPGMWHSLTEGEPDDNVEIVFRDIFEWLEGRNSAAVGQP